MNRFRTKKKAKDAAEGVVRGSTDSDVPSMPAMKSSKTFRLGRKHQEPEPKLELDLANALPPSDDFRTSLLMSGLSARFSMLREQDDPKSKIGKASDDSVLFPSKRQSRMNDFGFQSHGLSDIAEVSSINGSIRPPFTYNRTDSYDTTGSNCSAEDGGSIMNRAKPGEGNNLFGGRQKIYKIPVGASGSTKSLNDGSGSGMGGRAIYENDVSQSAFQKLREREKEQQQQEREDVDQQAQTSRSGSPPLSGYNRNRETSSTTSSSGPSFTRSSTAATSFTSQRTPSLNGSHTPVTPGPPSATVPAVERAVAKGRRLYETGLDQHLHEQQFSAMNRIDTLTRQRNQGAQTPPLGMSSPTVLNHPADRWERHQIAGKASMPNMRTANPSPTVGPVGGFDFGVRTNNTLETKPAFGMVAPLSPPMSENDEHAVLAVQPNDRGKATALGTFSKPVQPYDENKYTQRQLQMQQGRETSPLRKPSPPHTFVPRQQPGRSRAESNTTFASDRSRSNSSMQRQFLPQDRIPETPTQVTVPEDQAIKAGAFLSSPNGSSLGSPDDIDHDIRPKAPIRPADLYTKYRQEQPLVLERPPESQHPAHRLRPFEPATNAASSSSEIPATKPRLRIDESPDASKRDEEDPADSPTLGPATGLSGMVRQHLRSDSNTSSVYGATPSAGLVSRFPHDNAEPMPQNEYTTKDNPWETDDWDQSQSDYDGNNFHLESALNGNKSGSVTPAPLSSRSPNVETSQDQHKSSWEKELETHHTRDGSSETQKERLDFKNDLAARRRRVQENLKSFVETDSRSASPLPGAGSEWPRDGAVRNNPLGLLKKTSRSSIVGRQREPGQQSKAMKMLGIGSTTISSSPSPGKSNFDDDSWKHEEEEMLRGVSKDPIVQPQTKAFRQARRDAQRDRERQVALRHQQRMAAEANGSEWPRAPIETQQRQRAPSSDRVPPKIRTRHRTPSRERHPPPVVQNQRNGSSRESQGSVGTKTSGSRPESRASRDRSSSDASGGRSKSRNGRYKDDLAKAMGEGIASSAQGSLEDLIPPPTRLMPRSPGTPQMQFSPSPIPSPLMGTNIGPNRNKTNGKSTAAGYFESQNLQPLQMGSDMNIGLSPRPSPITPFSINSTPSLAQPSPIGSTPSGASTPTAGGFQSQGRIPTNRKRSINKSDISEPQFISSTSRIPTVDLAPGVSLKNGSEAPPIPPVNPKRKTRAMFGFGKKDELDEIHSLPGATQSTEEMSTFSADEGETKQKTNRKLRKTSSEGGNLHARAKQAAITDPSPALPSGFQPASGSPPRRLVDGGMF